MNLNQYFPQIKDATPILDDFGMAKGFIISRSITDEEKKEINEYLQRYMDGLIIESTPINK